MQAWLSGAFERCLVLCDAVRARDARTRFDVALLRARALLRVDRADDALRVTREAAAIPCGTEESLTLRMLEGAAWVRRGDVQEGLTILRGALRDAGGAHATVRSEIALNVALAHYALRDFDAAERALNLTEPASDIVHARALEYRGWIAFTQMEADRAIAMFAASLRALDGCRHYDRFLEANAVRALAHLAVERLDRTTWALVEERRARIDWSTSGLAQPRFWIAYCAASFAADVDGDLARAVREARHADEVAVGSAYRAQALCKRAAIARVAGEPLSQRDHAESAIEFYSASQVRPTGDDAIVALIVAEELAALARIEEARVAFDSFTTLRRTPPTLLMTHTPVTEAYRRFVEAAILEAEADRRGAARRYREAFDLYAGIGYKRRAVMAALRLTRLRPDANAEAYAHAETRHLAPHAWLRREAERVQVQAIKLTAVQREVLTLICQGKSNPEIARSRRRSLHTIRNLIARLFEVFEVSSREELAVESVRRGLYAPK